jgi:hypothetical protein
MAKSFQKLRELSNEELINQYDQKAVSTSIGLNFLANEIQRRENKETNKEIVRLTALMKNLTIAITFLTIVNVLILLIDIFK